VIKADPTERSLGDPAFYTIILASSVSSKSPNMKRVQKKSTPNSFTNMPQNDPSEESKFQFLKEAADHAILGEPFWLHIFSCTCNDQQSINMK
jgi:hypothetical protein